MTSENLTEEEEAIEITGIELVELVESENCDFTNTVTDGTEWAGFTTFSATVKNDTHKITAYYFQESDDLVGVEELSDLLWDVSYYDVEEL